MALAQSLYTGTTLYDPSGQLMDKVNQIKRGFKYECTTGAVSNVNASRTRM